MGLEGDRHVTYGSNIQDNVQEAFLEAFNDGSQQKKFRKSFRGGQSRTEASVSSLISRNEEVSQDVFQRKVLTSKLGLDSVSCNPQRLSQRRR